MSLAGAGAGQQAAGGASAALRTTQSLPAAGQRGSPGHQGEGGMHQGDFMWLLTLSR